MLVEASRPGSPRLHSEGLEGAASGRSMQESCPSQTLLSAETWSMWDKSGGPSYHLPLVCALSGLGALSLGTVVKKKV